MAEPKKIAAGAIIEHWTGPVRFEMDQFVSLDWTKIFSKQGGGTFLFNNESSVLDLDCLRALHVEKEKWLPTKFFVRPYLQTALKYRLANDDISTVVYGSPGVGKSVFSFLAAIALASTGNHDAVLYVRKVSDKAEKCTSAFWMTKAGENTVEIVACREIWKDWSVSDVTRAFSNTHFEGTKRSINKTNNPTSYGIKIIVDGPRYEDDTVPGGSDLITRGGCPSPKQDNMDSEWQFPLNAWSFQEMAPALKAVKNCNRNVAKRVFETTGGSIRLALKCLLDDGTLDAGGLESVRGWMREIAEKHASETTIEMVYYSTVLSADPYSLDRLRSMIVRERPNRDLTRQTFERRMLLASPYVAGLLQSKLTVEDMLKALNFARKSRIGSLYGWHFELWAHKVTEIAIDKWRQEVEETMVEGSKRQSGKNLGHVEGQGTGKESVKFLDATWLYWKPSIPNFANIDAAILLEDGTLMCLQFTVDTAHGFNFKTFKSDFVDQIPEQIRSQVKKIVVKFVIPIEKETFSSVRVPHAQAVTCTSVVANEDGSPQVHYVRSVDDNSMDTGSIFSHYTDYDEDLDYEFFHDETGASNLELKEDEWDMEEVKIVFQWMAVDPDNAKEGIPFFNFPTME